MTIVATVTRRRYCGLRMTSPVTGKCSFSSTICGCREIRQGRQRRLIKTARVMHNTCNTEISPRICAQPRRRLVTTFGEGPLRSGAADARFFAGRLALLARREVVCFAHSGTSSADLHGHDEGTLKTMQAGEPLCRESDLARPHGQVVCRATGRFSPGREGAKEYHSPSRACRPTICAAFNDALVAMDATLSDAERRFGKKTRILDHPILGPLTAEEWRRFHRVHADHHFRQIAARGTAVPHEGVGIARYLTDDNPGQIQRPRRLAPEDRQQRTSAEKNAERNLCPSVTSRRW